MGVVATLLGDNVLCIVDEEEAFCTNTTLYSRCFWSRYYRVGADATERPASDIIISASRSSLRPCVFACCIRSLPRSPLLEEGVEDGKQQMACADDPPPLELHCNT